MLQNDKNIRQVYLHHVDKLLKYASDHGIEPIASFKAGPMDFWEQLAYDLSAKVGSWPFTIATVIIVVVWFTWNSLPLFQALHFDEFPFIFLNLALSAVAGFQAPIILMAQNAQYARDLQRDEYHNQVQRIMESELRAVYFRLTNIELDLAVATEETNMIISALKDQMDALYTANRHLENSTNEYKNRVDEMSELMKSVEHNIEEISREHITMLQNMINTILKERTDGKRSDSKPASTGTGDKEYGTATTGGRNKPKYRTTK